MGALLRTHRLHQMAGGRLYALLHRGIYARRIECSVQRMTLVDQECVAECDETWQIGHGMGAVQAVAQSDGRRDKVWRSGLWH